jgi:transcriptional regulator with XRE-family HTH domain
MQRVENGHLVPSIATLEKLARALAVPLYQLFYEGKKRPVPPHFPKRKLVAEIRWGTTCKEINFWMKLGEFLARRSESERRILFSMAQKMAKR